MKNIYIHNSNHTIYTEKAFYNIFYEKLYLYLTKIIKIAILYLKLLQKLIQMNVLNNILIYSYSNILQF
ncbi:hypothetical protein PFUGPA_04322 [Plasmodium falciparum Palo Alto/Uganda]|uniref:Uncharacterized protein n=5 Tax=Plasmodium falciparum TaxID=5833 RepID=W4IYP7_PLAFP|nr:hypothetical protein PFTANZ_05770 [Plasmodium falciparum Tanzania (2000708)]ETW40206.1 hypothetical protein PFNF135_05434 [Plasmodium falciparum NF135/5.C10]ETW54456.1 hypothetical protein PFUGPA_04322 [Plasmodium falciparum Palo Alto/Uganda]ETW58776.1 hypothetical protein PFMC_05869 [Plasmodium falciparum CAMP/Malaysia]EUR62152.1 hypothetical protein PFBG_05866 [Plasmodium falciparum 7G8]